MAKVTWKGSTLCAPLPTVLVTCGTMEQSNLLTVAWAGIVNTHPAMTYISVRPTRYSYSLIKEHGAFVMHPTPASLVRTADFCGMYTGRKVDKFSACQLTKEVASTVCCPVIAQAPLALECQVKQILPLGTHDLFLAEITAVSVEESLLDQTGKLHLERAQLCAFAHGAYYALGQQLGTFGFSVRKANPHHRRPSRQK